MNCSYLSWAHTRPALPTFSQGNRRGITGSLFISQLLAVVSFWQGVNKWLSQSYILCCCHHLPVDSSKLAFYTNGPGLSCVSQKKMNTQISLIERLEGRLNGVQNWLEVGGEEWSVFKVYTCIIDKSKIEIFLKHGWQDSISLQTWVWYQKPTWRWKERMDFTHLASDPHRCVPLCQTQ